MRPTLVTAAALTLWSGIAAAQPAEPLSAMIGREVRSPDRDRVIGEVEDVTESPSGQRFVIHLEDQDRSVAVDWNQLQRQGGKLYLDMTDAQIAALPEEKELTAEVPEGEKLPYGGLTPGWGMPGGGR